MRRRFAIRFFLLGLALVYAPWAQRVQAEESAYVPDYSGTRGTVIALGGGDVPDEVWLRLRQQVGDDGPVVILSDAAEDPIKASEEAAVWLQSHEIKKVAGRTAMLDEAVKAGVLESLRTATAVWICGGQQSRLAEAWTGTAIEASLQQLLERGGMIVGTSAGTAILSKRMIASGKEEPEMSTGWDLVPDTILDQHFTERSRLARSCVAVDKHPVCVGLGIDEATGIVVQGREIQVIGRGRATVILGACAYREREIIPLASGARADLTQFRRAARRRVTGIDPGMTRAASVSVSSGSLVIVGGGAMPQDVVDRFIQLAGGEQASIVVLPTATPRDQTDLRVPGFLRQAKIKRVTVLDQRGKSEVDSVEFREVLEEATGVWFGGGRQWNFVDAYEHTEGIAAFHAVLSRGGVIAGSSAGATIQGEFLVRGHPLGNTVMMAEGYERGFSFLPGSAIDQHFAQRQRQADLLAVIHRHPGLLGIGLDEGTAIVVRQSKAEVIGQHSAHFLSGKRLAGIPAGDLPTSAEDAKAFYVTVATGGAIDLGTLTAEQP